MSTGGGKWEAGTDPTMASCIRSPLWNCSSARGLWPKLIKSRIPSIPGPGNSAHPHSGPKSLQLLRETLPLASREDPCHSEAGLVG